MYANFIYFIVVLLIYSTYQPADEPNFNLPETLVYTIALASGYALLTWLQFRRLENRFALAYISERSNKFH